MSKEKPRGENPTDDRTRTGLTGQSYDDPGGGMLEADVHTDSPALAGFKAEDECRATAMDWRPDLDGRHPTGVSQ